mmetsp:Transcript_64740/g.128003  ORF Transcript_64740/g.128003 Transcript_64740/m.128003 type:complete len:540 (-) Transcript_64740:83-1702(-)
MAANTAACGRDPPTSAEVPLRRQHIAASQRFVAMLLQMRENSHGLAEWRDGMSRIFQAGPTAAMRTSGALRDAEFYQLIGKCGNDLYEFSSMAAHIAKTTDAAEHKFGTRYTTVSGLLDTEVHAATTKRVDLSSSSGSRNATEDEEQLSQTFWKANQVEGIVLSHTQLFIHLPLTMYVQDTLHLYEMLARLNSEVSRGVPGAEGPGANFPLSRQLRAVLDQGLQPYSWLVFSIMGALQLLHRAKRKLAGEFGDGFPLGVLATTPACPHECRVHTPLDPTASASDRFGLGLMFRGLWVPPCVDEDRARHQYSFNSFSRTLGGALFVLNQYARVLPLAQRPDWHVLLLVGRNWTNIPWMMPVQLFTGSGVGESEKELIAPPFMTLSFEDHLELNTSMPTSELDMRAHLVLEWLGLPSGWEACSTKGSSLNTLGTLLGPAFMKLMAQSVDLFVSPEDDWVPSCEKGPSVTVRFISSMDPRPAVRRLFDERERPLFAFPPGRPEKRRTAKTLRQASCAPSVESKLTPDAASLSSRSRQPRDSE